MRTKNFRSLIFGLFFLVSQMSMNQAVAQKGDFRSSFAFLKERVKSGATIIKNSYSRTSGAEKKTLGGLVTISAGASGVLTWFAEGIDEITHGASTKLGSKTLFGVAVLGIIIVIDGVLQESNESDGSYILPALENLFDKVVWSQTLHDSSLTAFYKTNEGFPQYLALDVSSAQNFAEMDPDLNKKVSELASFIRSVETSGAKTQIVVAKSSNQ